VVIGTDGTVRQLSVISGPPELVQAAIDAVKQWRYIPTTLNRNPVEVATQVDILFSLAP
jgi:outer membrane biosynthesis protein TonB